MDKPLFPLRPLCDLGHTELTGETENTHLHFVTS